MILEKAVTTQSRRIGFYVVALLIPFLFIALLELTLSLVGFGKTVPLAIPSSEFPGYSQLNPNLIHRYFPNKATAPNVSPDTVLFETHKSEETFRIVIQGGSSAAGFPYGRFGSLQGMLEQRFNRVQPSQRIEVINTAMAAVNTYTLLDLVDDIKQLEPDLVLIYAGHNEYLGIFGVGSAYANRGGRFATLAYLELKDTAIYQAFQAAYNILYQDNHSPKSPKRSLMAQAAQGQYIPFGSSLYLAGVKQFEENLSAILSSYQEDNIPVMVGNLVSIEKQFKPFSARHFANDEAGTAYEEAETNYKEHRFEKARTLYKTAKNLDQLRFRAPTEFNDIVSAQAREHGAVLVDVEKHFRADTPDQLIGQRHMLEHVHPTPRGYFLLADAFYQRAVQQGLVFPTKQYTSKQAWLDIPISELDELYGQLKIKNLLDSYPFTSELHPTPQFDINAGELEPFLLRRLQNESWLSIQQDLMLHYEKNEQHKEALRVAETVSTALPMSAIAVNNTAKYARNAKLLNTAVRYQELSIKLAPEDNKYYLNQAFNYFLLGRFDQSLDYIERAERLGAKDSVVRFYRNKVMRAVAKQNRGQ
jgi:tetratricopeptide (TPR) repeat protein